MNRQLAAIMFTDIEGYTALMQKNEKQAIVVRDKHRLIFNSSTLQNNGRILQYFGDGTLSTFDSAIDAVQCAIEMQLKFREDPIIDVRIGIHIGDIVYREDEIIGDGVNVAARIESLAVAGSVFVSGKVYEEIRNQESIAATFLKPVKFKNVENPIDVYAISNVGLIVPDPDHLRKGKIDIKPVDKRDLKFTNVLRSKARILWVLFGLAILGLAVFKYVTFDNQTDYNTGLETYDHSIAVLAFENMSGDPTNEYFSDGISEEILNSLVQVEGLKVAGRTSAFSFKGKNEDIRSIGHKLNVKMVLEGSIRKAGDRVRITAQLINVADGFHIWSETYDRKLEDIFAIQEEIAGQIVAKLKLQFQDSNMEEVTTPNMDAYDVLLKGIYFSNKDYEGTKKAMEYFQKAVQIDSNYATAYAWIGDTYINYSVYGFMSSAEAYAHARSAAQKALSLNLNEPLAHKVLAYVHLNYDWDWDAARLEYAQAVQNGLQAPDHFITLYDIFVNEEFDKSIAAAEEILGRDPFHIQSHWHLGLSYYFARRYDEALTSFNEALELDSNYSEGYRWKGLTLAKLGKFEPAKVALKTALDITYGQGPAKLDALVVDVLMGENEEVLQQLKEWEKSETYVEPMGPAILYALLEMPHEATVWLDKSYHERSFMMVSLKFYWPWDPIRNDTRFVEIYDRMNFPE